mmetsp:Transcript_10733/g.19462  ORF Transcript_10733/g.19462 Transcript_10733/m.19462 type:complete len:373 (+) Transcript_10733:31-1149(+)|eukprot:CAMPEP_0196240598 /NCGR_PEP_ID=MMETSP0913-20130531/18131_1 /TAXON_ID=49265 /ORGANISM="Thalassiosira rotula, Strain GSO102" /LENGTH=372 /DNA_ID=CAMNT_0041523013 /DNA_START=10 /DNA_END=1128 /DNA_ORIENTATION=+
MNKACRAAAAGNRHSIQELKARATRKVPRSSSYRKLWRNYCHRFAEDVQDELRQIIGSNVDYMRAAQRLEFELGATGANQGVMPDFSNDSALRGYSLQHFGRVRLLGDLITQTQPEWLERRVEELFPITGAGGRKSSSDSNSIFDDESPGKQVPPKVDLVSLGGGPGYDFVAGAALSEYRSGPDVHAHVYEYENQWESSVHSMKSAAHAILGSDRHRCNFGHCDITLPLSDAINAEVAEGANDEGKIFVCSYCVVENALALRSRDWTFFRDLFAEAADGALFFIPDTTHRLWPELAGVAKDAGLRFATPHLRCGKAGWHFVAFKDAGHPGDRYYNTAICRDLLERFKADNAAHLNRLERGWKRESRKIKGSK